MAILGEVAGNPVHNDPNAVGMALIDKVHEVFGGAVAGGDGIIARDLVAPGAIEGVLGHRQQLDVGKAQFLHVGNQPCRQFSIGEESRTGLEFRHGDDGFGGAIGQQGRSRRGLV